MTLEEQLAAEKQKNKDLQAKVDKVLDEKKEVLRLFEEKDKEEMTDSEKKIAKILEEEGAKRTDLEKKLDEEKKARESSEKKRLADEATKIEKQLNEKLTKVAKGDAEVLKKLQANIGLLKDLPKQTEDELTTAVNLAYNMMGAGSVNPLSATGGVSNNNPDISAKETFDTTDKGKAVASKLGMKFVDIKEGE